MKTNAIADEIELYLKTKHSRTYRNSAPLKDRIFPDVVFRVESAINSFPSEDLYVNIDVYENASVPVRTLEDIADSIDNGLNMTVINTETFNMHFVREQRQYISSKEIVGTHAINLRYAVRTYFK